MADVVIKAIRPYLSPAPVGWQPIPPFFKDILRKLEFSAQQSELWENPEDASIVAVEYRALAMKLEKWMEEHAAK